MSKSTKVEAHYQDQPKGRDCCERCSMYLPPHGCSAVAGNVSPRGWCQYFKRGA